VSRLSDLFEVRRRFFRSVHLATDALRPDACDGYVLTPLGQATLGRIFDGLGEGRTERAWTLTGPYGVGKSAFVVLLAQLLNGTSESSALRALQSADRGLERRLQQLRGSSRGFCPVLVSGTYGPLLPALLDAVERAILGMFRPSAHQHILLRELRGLRVSRAKTADLHRRAVKLFSDLAEFVHQKHGNGVVIVVDELGKCLEYAARGQGRADEVFLLQELAEAASRSGARPILLVTLLHQAFDRYAKDLAAETRAEWVKVQGRFEDVAFLDAPGELLRLAARSIRRRDDLPPERYRHYDALAAEAVVLGLAPAEQQATLRQLAPLHPTAALLLPGLCRGPLAQNERSLFGFLTSTADGAFGAFLASPLAGADSSPTYTVDLLYDFVAETLGPAQYTLSTGRHWAAIDEAIARLPAGRARDVGEAPQGHRAARAARVEGGARLAGGAELRARRARYARARRRRGAGAADRLVARGLSPSQRRLRAVGGQRHRPRGPLRRGPAAARLASRRSRRCSAIAWCCGPGWRVGTSSRRARSDTST
jgi:hypothetical protein